MTGLESSLQFASKRIDDLYNTSLPALSAHVERVSTTLAMQTMDIDVYRRKWALTLKLLKDTTKEDEIDTHVPCVQLARDTLEIEKASVWDFAAWHRLSQKADAGIIIRFNDISKRNMWLANAKNLKGRAYHISTSPDVPPVLRPMKKQLLLKRKDLPPEDKKRSFISYHRQWPYMDLAVDNNRFVMSDVRKDTLIHSVLGVNLMLSIQEPGAWSSTFLSKQSTLFSYQFICKEKCIFPEPHIEILRSFTPIVFIVSCNSATIYRHPFVVLNYSSTLTHSYELKNADQHYRYRLEIICKLL